MYTIWDIYSTGHDNSFINVFFPPWVEYQNVQHWKWKLIKYVPLLTVYVGKLDCESIAIKHQCMGE